MVAEAMIALFLGSFTGWLCTKMYYQDKINRMEFQITHLSKIIGGSGSKLNRNPGPTAWYGEMQELEVIDEGSVYGDDPFAVRFIDEVI